MATVELYGILTDQGPASQGGLVLVHEVRAELEWLFPEAVIVPLRLSGSEPVLPIRYARGMEPIEWPLDRRKFRA